MSKGNKSARRELERLYGKQCFIDKLHLREIYGEYIGNNQVKKVLTKAQQKKQTTQLTYHHMIERKNGGQATVENGALLSAKNHQWFNEQPKAIQEKMNNEFRKYKAEYDAQRKNGIPLELDIIEMTIEGIKSYHQISFNEMGIGYKSIRLQDNTEEDKEFLDMSEQEQEDYEKRKAELRKRAYSKFLKKNDALDISISRSKAHIDSDWQKQILKDLEDEFNERNVGGYGR